MNRLEKERERESSDDFDICCNFVGVHYFLPSFRVPWKQAPGWWWWWWWWSLFFRVFVLTRDRETWWVRDGWKLWLWLFNVAAVGLEPKEETKNLEREREKAMDGRTDIGDGSLIRKFLGRSFEFVQLICWVDDQKPSSRRRVVVSSSSFFPSSEDLCEE